MKNLIAFSLSIALLGTGLGTAHAQRAPISRDDRRTQRRAAMANMTPEQRREYYQNQWQQRYNAATPEQRARMDAARANQGSNANGTGTNNANGRTGNGQNGASRSRNRSNNGTGTTTDTQHEERMRALMKAAGITDKAQQDPVVAFVLTQEKARQPLIKTARDVASSLKDGKSTPEQITAKWATYETTLDQDKTRYQKDLATLDAKIGWSKDPRLKSFLTLVGVVNPDSLSYGGVSAIFTEPQSRLTSTTTPTTRRTHNN